MMQKFKSIVKKEFLYYLIILVILALIMHIDLLSDPLLRFDTMKEKENYFHPFFYSFIVYSIILLLRSIINLLAKLFKKKTK